MSSPPVQPNEPLRRPSVFISYASEDRVAVRLLREALDAAGLDVWHDESDLGGGDAWDQKIRRQIRDCDYFMPVISATTEQRKEGYFRREWRLATERSLDMADDVLFLIPVSIDSTTENGARVPDKFLAVQWLRLPGGQPTPALHHLVRRILAGDHHALTRPPIAFSRPPPVAAAAPSTGAPPLLAAAPIGSGRDDGPPPMPPFPHLAEKHTLGDRFRFFAEVLWWFITAGWLLFKRAPRWARLLITVWVVIGFISRCSADRKVSGERDPGAHVSAVDKGEARKAIQATAERFAKVAKQGGKADNAGKLAQIGAEIARGLASELKSTDIVGKQILAVPFALDDANEADARFLGAVFTSLYGRLAVERAGEIGLFAEPLATATDEALVALGRQLDAGYVLGAQLTTAGDTSSLTVRLLKTEDASVAWTGQYPVASSHPSTLSEQIATAVLTAVPKH